MGEEACPSGPSLCERAFRGEGVPPSHVQAGKGVLGILESCGGGVVYRPDGCSRECVGETPTPRKECAGLKLYIRRDG